MTRRTGEQANRRKFKRTPMRPAMVLYLEGEARANRGATGKELRVMLKRWMHQQGIPGEAPGVRAIEKRAREARGRPGIELDDPWSLGVLSDPRFAIPTEAIGGVLAYWKACLRWEKTLTIREALWAVRLLPVLGDASLQRLEKAARFYAGSERYFAAEGEFPDTRDLDAELAFQPWESPFNEWEYEQAVRTETVPLSEGRVKPRNISEVGPKDRVHYELEPYPIPNWAEAIGFLRRVAGEDVEKQPWWPQAYSVMTFWLREITRSVKKWEESYFGNREEEAWQEWEEMALRLARLVIDHAIRLERWEAWTRSEDYKSYREEDSRLQTQEDTLWGERLHLEKQLAGGTKTREERVEQRRQLHEISQQLVQLHEQGEKLMEQRWAQMDKAGVSVPEVLWLPTKILEEIGYESHKPKAKKGG